MTWKLWSLIVMLLAGFSTTSDAGAWGAIRIDGSSDEAANKSFNEMVRSLTPSKQRKVVTAVALINMAGVHTAYDVLNNPDRQEMSAAKIKDKISGMTADEIIEFQMRTQKPDDPHTK